jgi:hypothetical protein
LQLTGCYFYSNENESQKCDKNVVFLPISARNAIFVLENGKKLADNVF